MYCESAHTTVSAAQRTARDTMDAAITNSMYILIITAIPMTKAAVPGMFFWKPRVALDLAGPTLFPKTIMKPTWENVHAGYVVLIDGYQVGLTVAALAGYLEDMRDVFPHLHPGHAHYYTNMYRWALRHLSLIPEWLGGNNKNYMSTHKVWEKRFVYMDNFVPQWMRNMLFFVSDDSWKYEEWEWNKFVKYAEPAFGKHYRYPSKIYNDFNSHRIPQEDLDVTNTSIQDG